MIRRNDLVTAMELLAALRESNLNRSRLAQQCNINYGRLEHYVGRLLGAGWIAKQGTEGQEVFALTERGLDTLVQYLRLSNEYERGE